MEKLTMLTKVQKLISTLKSTECSQKEKLMLFGQIADCLIAPPSIRGNEKYLQHMSSAITILLMFCEECDSVIRMNAEEQLNRIIRFNEHTNIFRVQFDLYHEIKKNGNERSLRICLNVFAYYMHLIKQRKIRPFALNLLPCIYLISRRTETLLLESLSEFMKSFCKYLQICLNENEIRKLIEVFLSDTISDCAVKRRFATQNVIYIIENSRRKEIIARHTLNTALELLTKEYSLNGIIGVLGFLRTFLPIILPQSNQMKNKNGINIAGNNSNAENNYWFNIIIEIYDLCLNLLIDDRSTHSVINASLEVICLILNEPQHKLKHLLTSFDHIKIIKKKKSLTSLLLNGNTGDYDDAATDDGGDTPRKINTGNIKNQKIKSNDRKDKIDNEDSNSDGDGLTIIKYDDAQSDTALMDETTFLFSSKLVDKSNKTENSNDGSQHQITDQTNNPTEVVKTDMCSDIEMDSLKSCDIETEITKSYSFTSTFTIGNASTVGDVEVKKKKIDSTSLKSQKSTESIGSIFNSLFSNSNTESVAKFFRSPKTSSVPSTPKNAPKSLLLDSKSFVHYTEDDNLSLQSMGSRMSSSSHLSAFSNLDIIDKDEQISKSITSTPVNSPKEQYKLLPAVSDMTDSLITSSKSEVETKENLPLPPSTPPPPSQLTPTKLKNISIGTTCEQNLIYYTARLVSAKFLLTGDHHQLISDTLVRISIKNISLLVVANCVRLCPNVLLLPLLGNVINADKIDSSNDHVTNITEDDTIKDIGGIPKETDNDDVLLCSTLDEIQITTNREDDIQLNIIDDHFGKNSTDYLEFAAPLSKSIDTVLPSHSMTKDEAFIELQETPRKINKIWSKSVENICDTQSMMIKCAVDKSDSCVSDKILSKTEYSNQIIQDVLLYYNNIDPILRGNVIRIIGNFIFAVLGRHYVFDKFFHGENTITTNFLSLQKLLRILLKGLSDETHTVVKQALVSIENVLTPLMLQQTINANSHQPKEFIKSRRNTEPENLTASATQNNSNDCCNILLVDDTNFEKIKIENIINELLLVYENKYWVVQCKYCKLISKLDFETIKLTCGPIQAHQYETRCLDHLFALIGDKDVRIRTAAVSSLCQYIIINNKSTTTGCHLNSIDYIPPSSNQSYTNAVLLNRFVSDRVFEKLPKPLCYIKKSIITATSTNNSSKIDKILGKILYYLTNKLVELNSKSEQFGVINTIMQLIEHFNPIHFQAIWNEFNLLEICWSHINENYTNGIDLNAQHELIYICTNLLAGNIAAGQLKSKGIIDNLLHHNLKLLNIFHHVITNMRPIFVPKGQKNDSFFTGSKEFLILNAFGYFGNDYFYMKMYNLIQNSFNSYKTSINNSSATNMMTLLKTCLDSLAIIFEIKSPADIFDSIKLIEEVLIYLTSTINFEPIKSVICIRHMLKYMFSMTFICRLKQYDYFKNCLGNLSVTNGSTSTLTSDSPNKVKQIFDAVKEFDSYEPILSPSSSSSTEPSALSTRSNGSPKRMPGFDIRVNMGNHIKIFEPIVLRCLILFTKSHAEFQSIILEMLCQTLEFKVDYCLLDANNVFINFIYDLLERIETGTVRNCDVSIPKIMKFLFYLSKQREKKIITMPKIINITDTLLANNSILSSSTLALNELAFECFFKQTTITELSSELTIFTVLDLNTQKEVAFSMLIKFLYNIEIQYMIGTILLLNKSTSYTNNENEVLVNMLQLINDKKIIINNLSGYESVDILFKIIQTNFMLDEINFKKLLSIWFNIIMSSKIVDFNKISLITIFMENAILHAPEVYLLTHLVSYVNNSENVKSFNDDSGNNSNTALSFKTPTMQQAKESTSNIKNDDDNNDNDEEVCEKKAMYWMVKCLIQIITDTILFINENDTSEPIDDGSDQNNLQLIIGLFEKLLKNLISRVNQFPLIIGLFKQKYINCEFCEMIFTLKRQSINTILIFVEFLLAIDCDKLYILHQINNNVCCFCCCQRKCPDNSETSISNMIEDDEIICDRDCHCKCTKAKGSTNNVRSGDIILDIKLKTEVVRILCRKCPKITQWKSNELNILIEHFIEILLDAGREILFDMATSQIYSIKLLKKLKVLPKENNRKEILEIYLDILDNCHPAATSEIIDSIVQHFFMNINFSSGNIIEMQRSASILTKTLNCALKLRSTNSEINEILTETQYKIIFEFCEINKSNQIYQELNDCLISLPSDYCRNDVIGDNKVAKTCITFENDCVADSNWFINEVQQLAFNPSMPQNKIALLLSEIKIETKLQTIVLAPEFNIKLLSECFNLSFQLMTNSFKTECVQFNAHISCLKMNSLLKVSIQALLNTLNLILPEKIDKNNLFDNFNTDIGFTESLTTLMVVTKTYMENITLLEQICLVYVDSEIVDKYFKENLLKPEHYQLFIKFATISVLYAEYLMLFSSNQNIYAKNINKNEISTDVDICLKCTDSILKQQYLWIELNQLEKNNKNVELILNVIHIITKTIMADTIFLNKFHNKDFDNSGGVNINSNLFKNNDQINNESIQLYRQAVMVAKFIEISCELNDINGGIYGNPEAYMVNNSFFRLKKILLSLAISILRTDRLYFFSITPYEILINYDINLTDTALNCLPSIPIDYLNDIDIVDKFVKRINIFGFISRQNFEEFFMSLLVLVSNENDLNVIDMTEQFQIKNVCLLAILELLISCKSFAPIGRRDRKFIHSPRNNQIKADSISIKKLNKVLLLLPGTNIFSQSNLECPLLQQQTVPTYNDGCYVASGISSDNISTNKFVANQLEMNFIWQIIEEVPEKKSDVYLKNARYFISKSGIDLKSSVQLIFDVFSQLIEKNYPLMLPHLVKLCEICENREQFRWIKDITLKLREIVPVENAICHQSIIYCLCKSYAVLVLSLSDLTYLCTIIQSYLRSTHLFVRNATLRGLLSLLESCVKTNTTIGSLNDEISLIRNIVINYITKYGIIEESSLAFSDEHSKLVWTLNFYLIENTSKFIPDCNLLQNSIISANNILKRTIQLDQYLCILHGLERLVATNIVVKPLREKIEKIALDLVKLENERFSIPALILLVTCVYVGSAEHLENTEYSNGIIQDEPEIVIQFTEKIEVLFNHIKIATPETAMIYGNVLSQITKDLVPPNEILTKVIKELVTLSQPHCEVIAKIVFQVFRSAIDSSYLSLLQDWLICSLPNFMSFSINKAVWSLTVIFISASVNIHLIKIFPEILAKHDFSGDREMFLFTLTATDFYSKLNHDQKFKFKTIISGSKYEFIRQLANKF